MFFSLNLDWNENESALISFVNITEAAKYSFAFQFAQFFKFFLRDCLLVVNHRYAWENAQAWKMKFRVQLVLRLVAQRNRS